MTLGSLLQDHGYRTGVFGKWHMGMDWEPVPGDPGDWHWGTQVRAKGVLELISGRVDHSKPLRVGPTRIGFDQAFVTPSNNTRIPVFVCDNRVDGTPEFDENGLMRDPRVQRDTVDDVFRAEAVKFIDHHLADHDGRPFFLYLPLNAIHGTTVAPKRFEGASGDGFRSDKVLWVDESVGVILATLDARGLTQNTLVFFSADNGPIAPKSYNPKTKHRAAGPFRGYKADAWDGGFRVPFIARWPGRIEPGSTHEGLLCLTDMIATFSALLGEELPRWAGEDSVNQLPAILGETAASLRDELITQSEIGLLTVRKNGWKLILDTKGSGGHGKATPGFEPVISGLPWDVQSSVTGQLYHLDTDPCEQHDLYEGNPEKIKELQQLLIQRIAAGRSR
jgi:arylsulfatase A